MENVKHTPGPWLHNAGNKPFNRIVKSKAGDLIAKVGDVAVGDVEANARLIAAAPELLATLKFAQSIIGHSDDAGSKLIAEVIAKATGSAE